MPYGVLPNQQMSKIEQVRYLHRIDPQFKRKIACLFKNLVTELGGLGLNAGRWLCRRKGVI
jgi:hypothetical protein